MEDNRASVYRVSIKLLSLQKLCHMDVVFLRHIRPAFVQGGGANLWLDRQEVNQTLNRMFEDVSQEVPGRQTAVEQMCTLVFQLFDGTRSDSVSADSLQTLLIVLSAEAPTLKYTALLDLAGSDCGSISRSALTSMLECLSQVPAAVQESRVFGDVEAAVVTCFNGVWTPMVMKGHVLSWLQSEPPLLLWLPTLYRLFISQSIRHGVRCHTCKTTPITGLRYRCMRCVNVHVCQSCFLTHKHTRKHKVHHPVQEFCSQPSWSESVLPLLHRSRVLLVLLPRRLHSHTVVRSQPAAKHISHNAMLSSNWEKSQHEQVVTLVSDVRNLQREKRLLTQQLQDWKLSIQTEQHVLEDKYSGMEVTMETMRKHNMCLHHMITQALDKVEAGHDNMSEHVTMETEKMIVPLCDTKTCTDSEEDEQELHEKDEVESEEELIQFPTMHEDAASSQGEEGLEQGQQEDDSGAAGPRGHGGESGDGCPAETMLQESVERLRTLMETEVWRDRAPWPHSIAANRWTELVFSADQVEDSIHHLVDAVRRTCAGCHADMSNMREEEERLLV